MKKKKIDKFLQVSKFSLYSESVVYIVVLVLFSLDKYEFLKTYMYVWYYCMLRPMLT